MHVKRLLKRGLALCLAMAVAMPQAFASDALGSDLKGRTVELAPGVSVTDNSLWSATYSDLRTEYYVTYEPGPPLHRCLVRSTISSRASWPPLRPSWRSRATGCWRASTAAFSTPTALLLV